MGTQLPYGKGHISPPLFGPSIVAKQSPISAASELLLFTTRQWAPGGINDEHTRTPYDLQSQCHCILKCSNGNRHYDQFTINNNRSN